MRQNKGNIVSKFYRKRKRRFIISAVCLVILIVILPLGIFKNTSGNMVMQCVAIRVDDIQDYAFRDAQLFLLDTGIDDRIPLSLAVIAGAFGEDKEIVEAAKLAAAAGSEVASHGWEHENFTDFSREEQSDFLVKSKQKIRELFNVEGTVFVPPMFQFNEDTLTAMSGNGYTLISTYTQNAEPGMMSNIISIPGTVQLSTLDGETWNLKSLESLRAEISASIKKYGFAVIVTHPQEFLTDGKLDPLKTAIYYILLKEIKSRYTLTTLSRLGGILYPR
jgi:peptidoglycan/xylan/chitin deacetylase (PgdA/CDA1 family)